MIKYEPSDCHCGSCLPLAKSHNEFIKNVVLKIGFKAADVIPAFSKVGACQDCARQLVRNILLNCGPQTIESFVEKQGIYNLHMHGLITAALSVIRKTTK